MILNDINFNDFYTEIVGIFSNYFSAEEINDLMSFVRILSDANFRCYKANMIVIEERKNDNIDNNLISEMEWVARSVGEYRVSSKARINKYISSIKTKQDIPKVCKCTTDDILYSIGEMIDRLSIEYIKREDFKTNNRPKHTTYQTTTNEP